MPRRLRDTLSRLAHAPRLRHPLRLGFVAAAIALFVMALMPVPPSLNLFTWQDKVEHCVLFAALCMLGLAAWPTRAAAVAGGLLGYGIAMEIAQSFTAYRRGDVWDWVADAAGIGLALLVATSLAGRERKAA